MQKKCLECRLVNYPRTELCVRCGAKLPPATHARTLGQTIVRRAWICLAVCLIVIAGFYLSLIGSAKTLTLEQKQALRDASIERQKVRDQWRRERSKLTPEDEKLIDSLPGDYPERARIQLARCGANTPQSRAAYRSVWVTERVDLFELIQRLVEKDLFEVT